MSAPILLWPPIASAYAGRVDLLIACFGVLVALLSAPVFILMAIWAVRYRKGRRADRTPGQDRNVWLEVSWSVIPFLLIMGFFFWSTAMFLDARTPPADALVINVVAKQWMWKFQHASGAREINEVHVPLGRAVRLTMTSQDVIHSLYVPALRIKQDVLPERYTQLWFNADRPGTYPLRCAEYCGTDHSVMIGRVIVQREEDYARWLARAGTDGGLAGRGQTLFHRLGCSSCHGAGVTERAPSLAGIYGRTVTLASGRAVRVDDQYLRDSIILPNKDVTAGYAPIMPPYGGVLDEEQVLELVAYLKSSRNGEPGERGS
ncbi:cytochrome c oxidase subunit II (plasmid) [Novosphingobium sp. BL-8A]|uniref:cytochrome c oxidase subunit II n=1 Tax=Novosphingobium sp. BL-8A TaxID=3127639 RepID=UPI0037582467